MTCYLRTLPILAINCTAPVLSPATLVLAPLLQEQKRSLLSTYTAKKQVLYPQKLGKLRAAERGSSTKSTSRHVGAGSLGI